MDEHSDGRDTQGKVYGKSFHALSRQTTHQDLHIFTNLEVFGTWTLGFLWRLPPTDIIDHELHLQSFSFLRRMGEEKIENSKFLIMIYELWLEIITYFLWPALLRESSRSPSRNVSLEQKTYLSPRKLQGF